MGHFGYGKLIAEVTEQAMKVNQQYHAATAKGNIFNPTSWVDYFLIGDIYIIGFKLDLSESDIWWLLSLKKSAFEDSKVYFYDKTIEEDKKILLDCYGVEIPSIPFIDSEEDAFINYYKRVCRFIKAGNPMGI